MATSGGGTFIMKGTGMLVVSLRGVNCRFCSHLGCSAWKANILPIQVSLRVVRKEISIIKKNKQTN